MPGTVHIERADTVNITIQSADLATSLITDLTTAMTEQVNAGVDPETLEDIGYTGVPDEATAEHIKDEDRLEQDEINATTRRNFLRNVVLHADKARRLEGFQTNHQRRPRGPKRVNAAQNSELVKASQSLERACGVCALRSNCRLKFDIDSWLDIHPYKRGSRGMTRPGSLITPSHTESRESLLKALKKDPRAHCEPAKRKAT